MKNLVVIPHIDEDEALHEAQIMARKIGGNVGYRLHDDKPSYTIFNEHNQKIEAHTFVRKESKWEG